MPERRIRSLGVAMKIYTKTGDLGETSLLGGGRVGKDDPRIGAYGAVDELNAALGVARAECERAAGVPDGAIVGDLSETLAEIQHRLFDLGAELARPGDPPANAIRIEQRHVAVLEAAIDRLDAGLPPLREFVLPGGSALAAQLHVARCVCRRAERLMVSLRETEPVSDAALRYANRLSDLLFVMARSANQDCGTGDVVWKKEPDESADA